MPSNFKRATAAVNEEAVRVTALVEGGYLQIWSGAQPRTANSPVSVDAVLLVEVRFPRNAFGRAVNGIVVSMKLGPAQALATGTAAWFRALTPDGETPVFDGSAGTSDDDDLTLTSVSIQEGARVSVSRVTYRGHKE